MGTDSKMALALVGLGNQGQEHLIGAEHAKGVRFVAAVDPSESQRQATQDKYPELAVYASLSELAAAAPQLGLAGLVLCLPHDRYTEEWPHIQALQLPVLKEKPLARHVGEARQFIKHCQGRLKTAIQRRYHPSYQQLKALLAEEGSPVQEIRAWMHLGRPTKQTDTSWRGTRQKAGGGILLDAGYHLVDLVHSLSGPFELVSCTLWREGRRAQADEIEDEALVLGRTEHTWVLIDSRLGGYTNAQGVLEKSEGVEIRTARHTYRANRQQVQRDGQCLWQGETSWQQAMAQQLEAFAEDIRLNRWHTEVYWEQLPAMQLILQAYQITTEG